MDLTKETIEYLKEENPMYESYSTKDICKKNPRVHVIYQNLVNELRYPDTLKKKLAEEN